MIVVAGLSAVAAIGLSSTQPYATYESLIATDGPVAQFRFDDAVGSSTVVDTATMAGTYTATDTGITLAGAGPFPGSSSGSFGGSASYATLPSNPLNGATAFTAEAWVKWTGGASYTQPVFAFGSSASNFMYLTPASSLTNHTMLFELSDTAGATAEVTAPTLTSGAWEYVAVTESSGTLTLYLNGHSVGSTTSVTLTPSTLGTVSNDWLGKSQVTGAPLFNGSLSNVAFYTKALSASQVLANYNAGEFPVNSTPPSITGTAKDGQTLTAVDGTWSGLAPITYAPQWETCNTSGGSCIGITGATGTTLGVGPAQVGSTIRVAITATNTAGTGSTSSTQTATVVPLAPANTVLPAITGTAKDGQLLSVSSGTWTGTPPLAYTYQWQLCTPGCANIGGATASTYRLVTSQVGDTVRAVVTATNAAGNASVNSPATATIADGPPVNTVAPAISGTVMDGHTLTASTGTWAGTPTITYAYQWESCNSVGTGCGPISGATSSTYALTSPYVGKTIQVTVTATSSYGSANTPSLVTAVVAAAPPVNTVLPAITGNATGGQTLTASTGTWTGTPTITYTYQWEDCNSGGTGCSNITGATASTYVLAGSDVSHTVRIAVTATNGGGAVQTSSAQTGVVAAVAPVNTALPVLTGTVADGRTLTSSTGTWTGIPTPTYTYQWQSCVSGTCAPITGATGAEFTITSGYVGDTLKVTVTATNSGGAPSVTSAVTVAVAVVPPNVRNGSNPAALNVPTCQFASGVDCASGNLSETQTDLSVTGLGGGLALTRVYSAQSAAAASSPGIFGYGWSSSYTDSLSINAGAGTVTVNQANGSTVPFAINATGGFSAPGWVQSTLVLNGDGTYTYTLPDRETFKFSSTGLLLSEADQNANTTTLTYTSGQLTAITDAASQQITLTYYSSGLVKTATDPSGLVITYTYDANNNLQQVSDSSGISTYRWYMGYDSTHRMTSIKDADQNLTSTVYDSSNRVTSQTDPMLRVTNVTAYTGNPLTGASTTQITDPAGDVTFDAFSYGEATSITRGYGTPAATTSSTTYYPTWEPDLESDGDNNVMTLKYDAAGNQVYDKAPDGQLTQSTYNALHEPLTETSPANEITTNVYDGNGNLLSSSQNLVVSGNPTVTSTTSYVYNANGTLRSETDPANQTAGNATTYTYNGQGNVASQTDPDGDETTYSYDADGRQLTTTDPNGNVPDADAAEHTTTNVYNAVGEQTASMTSPSLADVGSPGRQLGAFPLLSANAGPENIVSGTDGNLWFTESWIGKVGRVTPSGQITEYPTGASGSSPEGLALGPDGNVWFADSGADAIGKITPSGQITEYAVPTQGAYPTSITAGPSANTMVFTESYAGKIGEINTQTDQITETSLPGGDYHPASIVKGSDGNDYYDAVNWTGAEEIDQFTSSATISQNVLQTGSSPDENNYTWGPGESAASASGVVWFVDEGNEDFVEDNLNTHTVSYVSFPSGTTGVYGLTLASDGTLWFTSPNGIGQLNPATGAITEYSSNPASSGGEGLTQGPDGNIWFVDWNSNDIYKLASGHTLNSATPLLSANAGPENIVSGADGNLWFTESWIGKVGRVTPSGTVTEYPTNVSGSTPDGMVLGPDGNMWFADPGANAIGTIVAGVVHEYPVPTANADPTSIAPGPGNTLLFTESNASAIGSINDQTDAITATLTLTANANPASIVAASNGSDYFYEYPATDVEQIGEINSSGVITETALGAGSQPDTGWLLGPGEIAAGNGVIWFVDEGHAQFGEMTLSSGNISYTPFPAGVTNVTGLTLASDGTLWFTEFSTGKVGQLDPSTGAITEYTTNPAADGTAGITQGPDGNIWFVDWNSNDIYKLAPPKTIESASTYDPDGNVLTSTDANGSATTTQYDADGEVTQTTAPDGSIQKSTYTPDGRLYQQTNQNNQTTTNTYDAAGNLHTVTGPLSRETTYTYDGDGNVKTMLDPAGRTTTYVYTNEDQLQSTSYSDGVTHSVAYTYYPDGQVDTMKDAIGTTSYSYDTLGRLTSVTNGNNQTIGYGYDQSGNETSITYPDGGTVGRTYYPNGNLATVEDMGGNTTSFSYDADGNMTDADWANTYVISGVKHGVDPDYDYSYNNQGEMTDADELAGYATPTSPLVTISDAYDKDGDVTQESSTGLGAGTQNYSYNARDQLVANNGAGYAYDPDGNATELAGGSAQTYDAADELTSGPAGSYADNSMGERTSGPGGATYTWNQAGDLTSANGTSYTYDGNGLLQSTTTAGTTSHLTWDPNASEPELIQDATGNYIVYGPDNLPIEEILGGGVNGDNGAVFFLHDQLGSTRMLAYTDVNGGLDNVESVNYSPYGKATVSGSASTNLLYAGQYTDPNNGLIYLRARWYDSATGQFLSVDPDDSQTGQPYNYADDNPITMSDPTGSAPNITAVQAAYKATIGQPPCDQLLKVHLTGTCMTSQLRFNIAGDRFLAVVNYAYFLAEWDVDQLQAFDGQQIETLESEWQAAVYQATVTTFFNSIKDLVLSPRLSVIGLAKGLLSLANALHISEQDIRRIKAVAE